MSRLKKSSSKAKHATTAKTNTSRSSLLITFLLVGCLVVILSGIFITEILGSAQSNSTKITSESSSTEVPITNFSDPQVVHQVKQVPTKFRL
jgi:hypothetical protein